MPPQGCPAELLVEIRWQVRPAVVLEEARTSTLGVAGAVSSSSFPMEWVARTFAAIPLSCS
jgi:hypothetical protein